MLTNRLQFAVVREDPELDAQIVSRFNSKKVLMIGSGGCTLFHLMNHFFDLQITVVEPNPAQIELIEKKRQLLKSPILDGSLFSVGDDNRRTLNNSGNFESLFRQFRLFIYEFVMTRDEWFELFETDGSCEELFAHPYWSVAFDLFYHDSILKTMFGQAAIQHAPRGSYPGYFRRALERGLKSSDRSKNYFLHHIFLGCYIKGREPNYLTMPLKDRRFEYVEGLIQDVSTFKSFDHINLSNIFDWTEDEQVRKVAGRIAMESEIGTVVMFRQLNNEKDFRPHFEGFEFVDTSDLLRADRSLFYNRIEVGIK
ncbi:MAG: DUF3419 family protein [Proteobacteria bacterium]|nr:MAG: DUF3419 family protein [Pseudomonadota bacterium]